MSGCRAKMGVDAIGAGKAALDYVIENHFPLCRQLHFRAPAAHLSNIADGTSMGPLIVGDHFPGL